MVTPLSRIRIPGSGKSAGGPSSVEGYDAPVDFMIIGAAKSGTSSLWALLRDHPDIWMPMPKELPFFNGPDHARGWDEFARRHLKEAPPGTKIGKATPVYMAGVPREGATRDDPEREIPERIARQLPDIKLIAILRDPVERALSHYSMARKVGAETRDPETALDELLRPEVLEAARREPRGLQGYLVLGEYGRVLRGYLDVFDASQLLTLSTAELADDPKSVLDSVWSFLGVDHHEPADLNKRYMVSADLTRRHRFLPGLIDPRRPGVRAVRKAVRSLPPSIRDPLRQRVSRAVARTIVSGGDPGRKEPPARELSPELRRRLVAHYEPDSAALEEMFGWSPSI